MACMDIAGASLPVAAVAAGVGCTGCCSSLLNTALAPRAAPGLVLALLGCWKHGQLLISLRANQHNHRTWYTVPQALHLQSQAKLSSRPSCWAHLERNSSDAGDWSWAALFGLGVAKSCSYGAVGGAGAVGSETGCAVSGARALTKALASRAVALHPTRARRRHSARYLRILSIKHCHHLSRRRVACGASKPKQLRVQRRCWRN